MTPEPVKIIKTINLAQLRHLSDTNHDDAIQYVSAFFEMPRSEESNENYWSSTPQELGVGTLQTPKQKRILHELMALQNLEQLNPKDNQESLNSFCLIWIGLM